LTKTLTTAKPPRDFSGAVFSCDHNAAQPGGFLWDLQMNTRLEFSANNGVQHANDNKRGTIRPLDHSDPRSLYHPSHKEQWLEMARALGRLEAREEYAMIHNNDER
jgi:hypothetical protein